MRVDLNEFSGDYPTRVGSAWLEGDVVMFSDEETASLCKQVAMDHLGPVTVAEPLRFLRSLPMSISGSMLRAQIVAE